MLKLIRRYPPGARLPSESDLAGRFHVSRVTIREALANLERQGLILRKQGLGTFANQNILQIQGRIDESLEFHQLIRASGQTPAVHSARSSIGRPTAEVRRRLGLAADEKALILGKVFLADGQPVIHVVNILPLRLLPPAQHRAVLAQPLLTEPLYTFLDERCGQQVAYQIADVRAEPAPRETARHLSCRAGAPLLCVEEVGYNAQDQPVFYSLEYYNTARIHFKLLRRPAR